MVSQCRSRIDCRFVTRCPGAQAPRPHTRQEIEKVERSARLQVKRESKLHGKARRAARTERRKQERERQLAASEEEHSSDTESGVDAVE